MDRNRIEQNMINLLELEESCEDEELQFEMEMEKEEEEEELPLTPFQIFIRLNEFVQKRYWKYMKHYARKKQCCDEGIWKGERCYLCKGWGSIDVLIKMYPHLKDIYL